MAGNRVGDQLLLEGVAVYELTESGWRSLRVLSLQEILDVVKPSHVAWVEKILRKLSANREITLSREMLLKPEAATSGSSIVLRKEGSGFIDVARISEELIAQIVRGQGLTLDADSDTAPPEAESDAGAPEAEVVPDLEPVQVNTKKKRRKR